MRGNIFTFAFVFTFSSFISGGLFAQVANDDPYGPGDVSAGEITTGCSYSAYNGNARRTVTDIVVAGAVGDYPLVFTRFANSRGGAGDVADLGSGGNWSHSYGWRIDEQIRQQSQENNGHPKTYMVRYPDGRTVSFGPFFMP